MAACSIMIRRWALLDKNMYQDNSLKISHDWDLWLKLARKYTIGYIPLALGRLRVHRGSETTHNRLLRKESRTVVRRQKGLVSWGLYYKVLISYYLRSVYDLLPVKVKAWIRKRSFGLKGQL